jgi:hypothetical protein
MMVVRLSTLLRPTAEKWRGRCALQSEEWGNHMSFAVRKEVKKNGISSRREVTKSSSLMGKTEMGNT